MPTRDPGVSFLRAFGRAVRARRTILELSQEDLGFRAELDRTYVSGVERGVRNVTLRVVLRLSTALGVDPADLLTDVRAIRAAPAPSRGRIASDRPR